MAGNAQTQAAGRTREAAESVRPIQEHSRRWRAAISYANDAYQNSGETLRDGSQAVAETMQDNPLGALLIAGASDLP